MTTRALRIISDEAHIVASREKPSATSWEDFANELLSALDDLGNACFDEDLLEEIEARHEDNEVKARLAKLDALEAHGVDNWEGYDEAMRSVGEDD